MGINSTDIDNYNVIILLHNKCILQQFKLF